MESNRHQVIRKSKRRSLLSAILFLAIQTEVLANPWSLELLRVQAKSAKVNPDQAFQPRPKTLSAEQVALLTKKKMTKANADWAQSYTIATVVERSNHGAPSNMTRAKKRPSRADDDASIDGNPVTPHPQKKAKFDGLPLAS